MAYEFIDIDFKGLMYDFRDIPEDDDPFGKYPELKKFREFKRSLAPLNSILVLRYISFVYDNKSPFRREVVELSERKRLAAMEAGFEVSDTMRFDQLTEEMIFGQNNRVNAMIVRYVRLHHNNNMAYLFAMEEEFDRQIQNSISGTGSDTKKLTEVKKQLKEIHSEMLADDNNIDLRKELYKYIQRERLGISPEEIAERISNGVEPISKDEIS